MYNIKKGVNMINRLLRKVNLPALVYLVFIVLMLCFFVADTYCRIPKHVKNEIKNLPDTTTIVTPCGKFEYSKEQLMSLYRCDKTSFFLVIKIYQKQNSEKIKSQLMEKYWKAVKRYFYGSTLPYRYVKPINRVEFTSDIYGNTGCIYYYTDGTYFIDEAGKEVIIGGKKTIENQKLGKELW